MTSGNHQELNLRDLFAVFRRRLGLVCDIAAFCFVCALAYSVISPQQYQASELIQVQSDSSNGLDPNHLLGVGPSASDALSADVEIQTQADVLQSNALALRTISDLKLENTQEFNSHARNLGSLWNSATSADSSGKHSPAEESTLLAAFHQRLVVKPVPGTRLIEIDYLSTDPKIAASIVDCLAKELINYNYEIRSSATKLASTSLGAELDTLKNQSEQLEKQVAKDQAQTGLYSLGTTDAAGREQTYSSVLDQFQRATITLDEATQNQALKKAIYQAAQTGNAELISSLAGNSAVSAASSGVINSLATIQTLRSQQATAQAQLDQLKVKFGPNFPRRAEVQATISGLDHSIQQEIDRVTKRAESDFLVANQTLQNATDNYNQLKIKAGALNNNAVQYMIARQEADGSRSLYEDFSKHLKEAWLVQDLKSSLITVVDPALIPTYPSKPNTPLILLAGVIAGFILGSLAALLVDLFDDTVHDTRSLDQMSLPVIGVVPGEKGHDKLPQERLGYINSLEAVRSSMLSERDGQIAKTFSVTGTTGNFDTATFCVDLASSFVASNKLVLLVEANVRNPTLRKEFGLSESVGLSLILGGALIENSIAPHPRIPHLYLLPAGPSPISTNELYNSGSLNSLLTKAAEQFDTILVSAPPAIPFADAMILADLVDVSILVAQIDVTPMAALRRAYDLLTARSRSSVGIVLTGVEESSPAYRNYYGHIEPSGNKGVTYEVA